MSEFKIRRGQVFYIPKVKNGQSVHEPYIVLSNNRCNESSNAIHVAPIRVGLASMDKYYQCGFTATCNRDMYVDAAGTTLIDKTQFTEDRYSSAMSFYTVNNKLLLESIEEALCVQLGINKNYVVYGQEESTTKAQEPIQVTINMNITGMDGNTSPVTMTTEPVITATQKKEPDVYIKPEMVRKSVETTQGMSKIVGVSKMYTDDSNGTRRRFTDEMKNKIMETILTKAKAFGGESRSEDIAAELGISVPTVNRYIAKAKEEGLSVFSLDLTLGAFVPESAEGKAKIDETGLVLEEEILVKGSLAGEEKEFRLVTRTSFDGKEKVSLPADEVFSQMGDLRVPFRITEGVKALAKKSNQEITLLVSGSLSGEKALSYYEETNLIVGENREYYLSGQDLIKQAGKENAATYFQALLKGDTRLENRYDLTKGEMISEGTLSGEEYENALSQAIERRSAGESYSEIREALIKIYPIEFLTEKGIEKIMDQLKSY